MREPDQRDLSADHEPTSERTPPDPGPLERAATRISARRVLLLVTLALLPPLAVALLWVGRDAFFILFAGMLLAALLDALIRLLVSNAGIGRNMAAGAVIGAVVVVLGTLAWWGGNTAISSAGELYAALDEQASRVGGLIDRVRGGPDETPETPLSVMRDLGSMWGGDAGGMAPSFVGATFGALANTVLIFFLGVFLAVDPGAYKRGAVRLFPRDRRATVDDALHRAGETLRLWLVGKLISMALVALLTGAGLLAFGYPFAVPLALLAGALAFVPNLGPILTYVPIALVGLSADGATAVTGVGVYAAVQVAESYLVTPLIQRRMVSLPPALILFAQVLGGIVFGLWGVALATPIAAVLRGWVERYYVRRELEEPDPPGAGHEAKRGAG